MNRQLPWKGLWFSLLCLVFAAAVGCDQPTDPGDNDTVVWTGLEAVIVSFGTDDVVVYLEGMPVSIYEGIEGVRLSDIVTEAALVAIPAEYFFNFIASDGFDMSKMAMKNQMGLPTWNDMQKGYVYDSGSSGGLSVMWEAGTPPGDFGRFYNCKLMDGGTIQMLAVDVL